MILLPPLRYSNLWLALTHHWNTECQCVRSLFPVETSSGFTFQSVLKGNAALGPYMNLVPIFHDKSYPCYSFSVHNFKTGSDRGSFITSSRQRICAPLILFTYLLNTEQTNTMEQSKQSGLIFYFQMHMLEPDDLKYMQHHCSTLTILSDS